MSLDDLDLKEMSDLSALQFRRDSENSSSLMSSIAEDFGSDPVARMTAENLIPSPEQQEAGVSRPSPLSSIFIQSPLADDPYVVKIKADGEDDDFSSNAASSPRSGEFAV